MSRDPYYKRCGCRGDDGKLLGPKCPKLRRADGTFNPRHGTWHFHLELPAGPGGRRRQMRQGGFASRGEAEAAREQAKARLRLGGDPATRDTVGPYLQAWLDGRRRLKASTHRRYQGIIDLYLVPLLGHIKLDQLRAEDVSGMFATIREWNAALAAGEPVRKHQHHVSPATMQRIRAVLRGALNDAGPARVPYNPARGLEMDPEPRQRPKVWTPERVAAFWAALDRHMVEHPGADRFKEWRNMSRRPGHVMVWTPEQTGRFLDSIQGDPLAELFELVAATGIRRGEACGLPWTEVTLGEAPVIEVTETRLLLGTEVIEDTVKSDAGHRIIPLDQASAALLQRLRKHRPKARLRAGSAWAETGLVFIQEDGSGWHPDYVTRRFGQLAYAAGLPPVTVHGLRHGTATYALAAGVDRKVVQELLGHSTSRLTSDTYTSVLGDLQRTAVEATVAMIPRTGSRPDVHT